MLKKIVDLLKKNYNRIVLVLMWLPSKPTTLNRWRFANARSAKRTIEICEKNIGFIPEVLFDCGANESQWAWWINKKWPQIKIESFEPQLSTNPFLGDIHRVALSDVDGEGTMNGLILNETGTETKIRRFDQYWDKEIPKNSLLKIDTDAHGSRTVRGFGERIKEFRFVIIEVCWDCGLELMKHQAHDIIKMMSDAGFNRIVCVDADFNNGKSNYCDLGFFRE